MASLLAGITLAPTSFVGESKVGLASNLGRKSWSSDCLTELSSSSRTKPANDLYCPSSLTSLEEYPVVRRIPVSCDHTLLDGCVGGTYLVSRNNINLAIWKPWAEEAGKMANPKGETTPFKGFRQGSGYLREVAAFELDHFNLVPATELYAGPQGIGSLQRYVANDGFAEEFGSQRWRPDEVHRLGLLDLRLLNTDRHGANLLVSGKSLVPIDHGLCLGSYDSLSELLGFEWQTWEQATVPFSAAVRRQVAQFDIAADLQVLLGLCFTKEEMDMFYASAVFLKEGVAAGLTLAELANFYVRPDLDTPSSFEDCVALCQQEGSDFRRSVRRLAWEMFR